MLKLPLWQLRHGKLECFFDHHSYTLMLDEGDQQWYRCDNCPMELVTDRNGLHYLAERYDFY